MTATVLTAILCASGLVLTLLGRRHLPASPLSLLGTLCAGAAVLVLLMGGGSLREALLCLLLPLAFSLRARGKEDA